MSLSFSHILDRDVIGRLFLFLSLGAIIGVVIIFSSPGGIRWDSRNLYDLVLLLFLLISVAFTWRFSVSLRNFGQLDPFELPVWFTLGVFLALGLSGRQAFADYSFLQPRLKGDYYFLNLALIYVSMGIISLWLGYAVGIPRFLSRAFYRFHQIGGNVGETPRLEAIYIIYGLGVVVRLILIASGAYSYLADKGGMDTLGGAAQWLTYLHIGFPTLALAALALHVFRGQAPSKCRLILYGMILTEVFFTLVGGGKGPIIGVMIVLIGCSLYMRKSIPWKPTILLGLLFVLVIPINLLYREAIDRGQVNTRSFGDANQKLLELLEETWLSKPLERNLKIGEQLIKGRQMGLLQNIALALRYTPEIKPYLDGKSYWLLPVTILVPRILWQGKPQDLSGVWFSVEYAGHPANSRTSSAISPFGHLYLSFGWPGIIVGMFGLGMVYRGFYEFVRKSNRESLFAIYLNLILILANYESHIPGMIQGAFQGLAVYYVASRFMYVRAYSVLSKLNRQTIRQTRPV